MLKLSSDFNNEETKDISINGVDSINANSNTIVVQDAARNEEINE
jgi:hypothetical protein